MKKLFFILIMLLMSASVFSQSNNGVRSLRVENHTSCRQYYTVVGGDLCNCTDPERINYASNMIVINPGQMHFYADTTTLGNTFPPSPAGFIYLARIVDTPYYCPPFDGGTVGQPGCGGNSSVTYTSKHPDCTACGVTTATWYPADCEGMAKLVFTP